MTATVEDVLIECGSLWERTAVITQPGATPDDPRIPFPLTGFSAELKIRAEYGDAAPLVTLTSSDGLTIHAAEGEIDISLTADRTTSITKNHGYYDLEVTPIGQPTLTRRVLRGRVTFAPNA